METTFVFHCYTFMTFTAKSCLRHRYGDSYIGQQRTANNFVCIPWKMNNDSYRLQFPDPSGQALLDSMGANTSTSLATDQQLVIEAQNYCRMPYFQDSVCYNLDQPVCMTNSSNGYEKCSIPYCRQYQFHY